MCLSYIDVENEFISLGLDIKNIILHFIFRYGFYNLPPHTHTRTCLDSRLLKFQDSPLLFGPPCLLSTVEYFPILCTNSQYTAPIFSVTAIGWNNKVSSLDILFLYVISS